MTNHDPNDAYYHDLGRAPLGPLMWVLMGELQAVVPDDGPTLLRPKLIWYGPGALTWIYGADKPKSPSEAIAALVQGAELLPPEPEPS